MDDTPTNGLPADVAPAPRRYFDGDESRYRKAAAEAEGNENAILQWLTYLKGAAVILSAVCLGLVAVVVALTLRSTTDVKFVVQNEQGQLQILGWDEYHPEVGVMKRDLEGWLRCARTITTDRDTHQRCWRRVPMFIKKQSQCATEVQQYANQRKPDHQLYQKSVVVQDLQGSREPDGRWRFSWMEKTYQLDHGHAGPLIDTSTWHAILIVTRQKPAKPEQILDGSETVNPLGLLCTELAWWK
jgi:type IV secretory pathway TrbF-like protein